MGTDVETWGFGMLWAPSEELPRETHVCTQTHTQIHTPTQTYSYPTEGLSDHLPRTADSVSAYLTGGHLFLPQYSSPQTLPQREEQPFWGGVQTWDLVHRFLSTILEALRLLPLC